jgi:hypothetical protein
MDQFSFHGPFAYRWINDVPVERIDLRSGERRSIEVISGAEPVPLPGDHPTTAIPLANETQPDGLPEDREWRAAMAAWN